MNAIKAFTGSLLQNIKSAMKSYGSEVANSLRPTRVWNHTCRRSQTRSDLRGYDVIV